MSDHKIVSTITVLPLDNIVAPILFWLSEAPSAPVRTGRVERQSTGSCLNTYGDGPLLSGDIHGTVAITVDRDQSLSGIDGKV